MPPKAKKKEPEKPPAEEQFSAVEVSTRDPRTVVLMLDSPEATIVCKACTALHKHLEKSEQHCLELLDMNVVPRLVHLLASPEKATRAYAVLCLAAMATSGSVRKVLYRSECIPPLLALLQPEEEVVCQERASFTVAELAGEYSFKAKLHKHSSLPPLITLLHSTDPDIQRNCLRALSQLVEHYQCRPAVREAGGLPSLLELLGSEYAAIQELTLKTLLACMHDAGCREAFREADGLSKLVAFIGNKDCSDLHVSAMAVLSVCLEDTEQMVALQSSGCLGELMTHTSSSTLPEMKRNAAAALSRAARNEVNRKILREQEVEKMFIDLLSSEDEGVCVAGAEGLAAMAELSSSRQASGEGGGVEGLVKVMGKAGERGRGAAVHALSRLLADAPANCRHVSECGGVEVLVQLLEDLEATCRRFAADCIISMAPNDSLRSELVVAGVVGGVVGGLQFADSAVQASNVEALGILACDSAARQQFLAGGGVLPLLDLLRSSSAAVRQAAVWTLSICAQSSAVAEAVCQARGLELVEGLCRGPAPSGSAHSALQRLLDSNLAAKYWVTGRLEQSDTIANCEFFDAGPAQSGSGPFIPLAELVKHPLHMNRPILTVSLLARPPLPPPPAETTPTSGNLEASQSTVSVGSRSKSRNAPAKDAKGKKGRGEREVESRTSEESEEQQGVGVAVTPGLLPPDPGLWAHITHTKTHIHPLPSSWTQVEQLASYVAEVMGGVVQKVGVFGYELSAGEVQREGDSNLLPLGEVTAGVFQHRALLFKVLCDQLGVGCSLVRGGYGRHWNEVSLMEGESVRVCVVDLMFSPGRLMPAHSPQAEQYQHI